MFKTYSLPVLYFSNKVFRRLNISSRLATFYRSLATYPCFSKLALPRSVGMLDILSWQQLNVAEHV